MVIVADSSDRRLARLTAVLDKLSVAHVLCRDVYSALQEILSGSGHQLVAGELSELCRQGGRFVEICAMRAIPCIGWFPSQSKAGMIHGLDSAIHAGAEIVGDMEALQRAVEGHLQHLSTRSDSAPMGFNQTRMGTVRREEALLTSQELTALFGDF
jgi:hypothetical protein